MRVLLRSLAILCLLSACATTNRPEPRNLDAIGKAYIRLALAAGQHDDNLVDAYYGPEAFKLEAESDHRGAAELSDAAAALRDELRATPVPEYRMERLRREYLESQLTALVTRLDMAAGEQLDFERQARLLYQSRPPEHQADDFEAIRERIAEIVPGSAPLHERVEDLRRQFIIPEDKLEAVFNRAIEACRSRTTEYLVLPDDESFTIEYVEDKPWSGYNWYQGDGHSLIQINTDLPIFIDRAVDLGCHEGYPGHHTYNSLLERELVQERGWTEFSVYLLFSPQSLIAEGSANHGIDMAFPGESRFEFERDVLMPLAGIDTTDARRYWQVRRELRKLDYAGNEAARRYINGDMSREETVDWLVRYTLVSPERARQRVDFFDTYGAYVINYNFGRDLVKQYVERNATTDAERWRVFGDLLSSPLLPTSID